MRTREIISTLIGKTLRLSDETLFEEITFAADRHAVQKFGEKQTGNVAGPVWDYAVTLLGKVRFGAGGRTSFIWDRVELEKDCLLVKCGPHSGDCRSFYRPVKRFFVSRV